MKKFLNYNFLMTILASVVVLLEILVEVLKIKINIEAVISISVAVIGLMVTAGIVNKNSQDKTVKTKQDLKEFYVDDDFDENITENDEKTVENAEKVSEKVGEYTEKSTENSEKSEISGEEKMQNVIESIKISKNNTKNEEN